jgi:hypothetical protein
MSGGGGGILLLCWGEEVWVRTEEGGRGVKLRGFCDSGLGRVDEL